MTAFTNIPKQVEDVIEKLGINPSRRPKDLSLLESTVTVFSSNRFRSSKQSKSIGN